MKPRNKGGSRIATRPAFPAGRPCLRLLRPRRNCAAWHGRRTRCGVARSRTRCGWPIGRTSPSMSSNITRAMASTARPGSSRAGSPVIQSQQALRHGSCHHGSASSWPKIDPCQGAVSCRMPAAWRPRATNAANGPRRRLGRLGALEPKGLRVTTSGTSPILIVEVMAALVGPMAPTLTSLTQRCKRLTHCYCNRYRIGWSPLMILDFCFSITTRSLQISTP